jgi:carbonic anhydrase
MKPSRSFLRSVLMAAVLPLLFLAAAYAAPPQPGGCPTGNWGYHKPIGPENWSRLSPCNCQCADGGEQSPIDIVNPEHASLPPLMPSYGVVHDLLVENNGHEVRATIPSGEPADHVTLRIGTVEFRLVQFHFHTPSEHKVAGQEAPIEMHLVHKTPGGRLAVVGVFIQPGEGNPELTKIWDRLPARKGQAVRIASFDLAGLLPPSLASYRYAGSLTTPACGQGVQWNVLAGPITLTSEQIRKLQAIFYGNKDFPNGNRRPVQPLNGRTVVTDVP